MRMEHGEFKRRCLALFRELLDLRGKPLSVALNHEASVLFGFRARDAGELCAHPPHICACGAYACFADMCEPCRQKNKEAALRAQIEAEVRAELAQEGGGKC